MRRCLEAEIALERDSRVQSVPDTRTYIYTYIICIHFNILDEYYSLIWILSSASKTYEKSVVQKEAKYFIRSADSVQIGNITYEVGVQVFLNAHSAGDFVQAKE